MKRVVPRRTRALALLPALWIGIQGCAPRAQGAEAQLPDGAREVLRREIQSSMDSAGIASLVVGVARDGVILWAEGFGHADLSTKRPATPRTPYSIASISKPIVATAVLRLAEQGRLSLDLPIDEYLGGLRLASHGGDRAGATVRRVLSHTSGLPLHYRFFYEDRPERPDIAETVERYGRVMFPPGEVYSYSNLGYGLLGEAVERVSGVPLQAHLEREIFQPLGMRHARIGTGAGFPEAAVRYDGRHRPIPAYDFDHRGASAVFASAEDLLRFAAFHLGAPPHRDGGRAPVSDAAVALMQRAATPPDAPVGYGLGWIIDREHGMRRVRHTGSMPGVAVVLAMYPDERTAVVVLSNQYSALPGRVATKVAASVLPVAFRDSLHAAAARPAAPSRFVAAADMRGDWRGTVTTYEGTLPISLRVDSGAVMARLGEGSEWVQVRGPATRGRMIGGRFEGRIPTGDASRAPHVIGFSLYLANDSLRGWVSAYVEAESDDFALSSYAALRRVATSTPGQQP